MFGLNCLAGIISTFASDVMFVIIHLNMITEGTLSLES